MSASRQDQRQPQQTPDHRQAIGQEQAASAGVTLARFLGTYAGRGAVEVCTPAEVLSGPPRSAEVAFVATSRIARVTF